MTDLKKKKEKKAFMTIQTADGGEKNHGPSIEHFSMTSLLERLSGTLGRGYGY